MALDNCCSFYITWTVVTGILYFLYKIWMEGPKFPEKHRADGKIVLITGANAGIGKETATQLAKRGARVIMACRNEEISERARQEIIKKSGNSNVELMILDLASFQSIRTFAKEFLKKEQRLDILINNAGIMALPKTMSENGVEMHMAVNYFGHFLLTMLLFGLMKKSQPSRIINVSSMGHKFFKFNKSNWNSDCHYNRFEAYCQSKLANVMFTFEMKKRIKNSGVTVNALHPGVVFTDLSRYLDSFNFILKKPFCDLISKIFLRSPKSGTETIVYAALDFNLQTVSGVYLDNMASASINSDARNEELLTWLWNKSEEVTGISWDEIHTKEFESNILNHEN